MKTPCRAYRCKTPVWPQPDDIRSNYCEKHKDDIINITTRKKPPLQKKKGSSKIIAILHGLRTIKNKYNATCSTCQTPLYRSSKWKNIAFTCAACKRNQAKIYRQNN